MSVSLSQINAFNPDPQLGSGQPSVVIDNSQAINNVLNAANIKANYDWQKYQQFLTNQQNFYKNLGDLSKVEIATPDRPAIMSGYKQILQQAMEHPEIFHGRNQKLFGELQAASGQLMQQATESKVNRLYDLSNREYLAKNPELNTQENAQKIQEYWSQPLGNRQNYILNIPGLFDPNELAKTINAQIEQSYANIGLVGGVENVEGQPPKITPGEKYIYEEKGKAYDPKKFMTIADQMYDLADKRGNQLRTEVTNRFQQLDPSIQQQYQGDPKKWYLDLMQQRVTPKAVTDKNLKENDNFYKAEELRQGWARIGIDRDKLNKEKGDDLLGADTIINEALAIIDKGETTIAQNYKGEQGRYQKLKVIGEPTLLESFAKIDKDGKLINQPDEVNYNPDNGQLDLVYFKKNATTGETDYGKDGEKLIKETKSLDERTWLKMIAKRSFPNKDIGNINSIVEQVYQKGGNSLTSLKSKLSGASTDKPSVAKTVVDYDSATQAKIKQWMKANKVTDEKEAIDYLRSKKLID